MNQWSPAQCRPGQVPILGLLLQYIFFMSCFIVISQYFDYAGLFLNDQIHVWSIHTILNIVIMPMQSHQSWAMMMLCPHQSCPSTREDSVTDRSGKKTKSLQRAKFVHQSHFYLSRVINENFTLQLSSYPLSMLIDLICG